MPSLAEPELKVVSDSSSPAGEELTEDKDTNFNREEMSTNLDEKLEGNEEREVSDDGMEKHGNGELEDSAAAEDGGEANNTNSEECETVSSDTLAKEAAVVNDAGGDVASSGNQQVTAEEIHKQKEAEIEAYLESLKPKPKRKSIKEMLMSLPVYKNLAAIKPRIGGEGGKKEDVIILDDDSNKRRSAREIKRQKQIEELKDRFVRHCITAPSKTGKGEHVKLKIKKKEEDSQGIEHLVENEVDYIRNPLNEDEEAVSFLTPQQSSSPQALPPGASRRRLQESLLEKIRARKLKEHEERVKDFNMYNDEQDEDGKDEKSEDEIEEDEELSENDSDAEDEEEEEELEDLLNSSSKKKKKKGKKSVFVEDEAEDEDGDGNDDDESDNEDSEDSDSTEEEDESEQMSAEAHSKDMENVDDLASIGNSEDSIPSAQVPSNKVTEISTPVKNAANEDSQKSVDFGADFTPKVTSAVLNQEFKRTPSDLWTKSNINCRQIEELSPTIPRISKSESPEEDQKNTDPALPKSLAHVISEPKPKFDDLVELCSGRFVSQVATTESQEDDEFSGFDFGDDEPCNEKNEHITENIKTPKTDCNKTAIDGITPKLTEKVPKTRLLMQFDEEAVKTKEESPNKAVDSIDSHNNLEEDEEIIGTRIKGRKQKRLQFSDDEDEEPNEEMSTNSHSDNEQSVEADSDVELQEEPSQEIAPAKPKGLFFNKHGLLKRKFVEDEAELSGSEEGSDDEDERGLNHYEMDEADEEEMDEEAVKHQIERAHLKQLLDDDDREIRIIQNEILQHGDLHSDKQRERKFTWKINMNELNDDAHFGDSDEEQTEETQEDASLKQAWIEKRKWMSENSHLLEADEDESQSLLSNSRFLKISKNTIKRLESFVDTSTSESSNVIIKETSVQRKSIYEEIIKTKSAAKKKEIDLTSCSEGMNISSDTNDADHSNKSMSQPLFGDISWTKSSAASKKGSFLSRGGMMLAKLAEGSKPGDAVSNVKNNSRNFVFQHITPPNPEKTDGSTSRMKRGPLKAGNQNASKKLKIDRSFSNLDEASKGASIFKWL